MLFRLATAFLVLLTIGFFALHKFTASPLNIQIAIKPQLITSELIAQDEYLLLLDEEDEHYLDAVLKKFDLRVVTPLEKWVHVAKNGTEPKIVSIDSSQGRQNIGFALAMEADPRVHSAHVNYIQTTEALFSCRKESTDDKVREITPKDPYFRHQWYLQKGLGINAAEAWSITTGSPHTVIAVVDRNFDLKEFDWSPEHCSSRKYYYENILSYFKKHERPAFDGNKTHGSNVLSVLAPCTDNALGLSGVDWQSQVFSVDSKSDASFSTRMLGLLWASGSDVCHSGVAKCPPGQQFQKNAHHANIINASFGFSGSHLKDPAYGTVLDIVSEINSQGRIIIASAGNEGMLADRRLPGSAGGVISVGASNSMRQSAPFSNYGRTIDVLAPGQDLIGLSQGQPISLDGTSFSAPLVSGVVSLMLAVAPWLSWKHAEYILKKTATPLSCNDYCPSTMRMQNQQECQAICCHGDEVICARGIIDALKAVVMAQEGIPKLALIDVDDYYLPLSFDNNLTTKLVVKNWGKKPGIFRMKMTDKNLVMNPPQAKIGSVSDKGVPAHLEVAISYKDPPTTSTVVSLILEIANQDTPEVFHDQIETIVEIVPDPSAAKKPRMLKELWR